MSAKEIKTNAMRILENNKINYTVHTYDTIEAVDGVTAAKMVNVDENKSYKTLVTIGKSKEHYVFIVPVKETLDLKKAARVVNEKDLEMIPQKELLPLTGYVHGGCSPIGMKKNFKTIIHESCNKYERIYFSGGKIGYLIEVDREAFVNKMNVTVADIIR